MKNSITLISEMKEQEESGKFAAFAANVAKKT